MASALGRPDPGAPEGGWPLPHTSGTVGLLLKLVVLFSLTRYLHDAVKIVLESSFIDFAHYYTYATLVAQGQNPFDPARVAEVDAALGLRRAGAAANYPPPFYLLMQPWVLLPFRAAGWAWFFAGQACLIGSLGLIRQRVPSASPVQVGAALFVLLNYQPLLENLFLGQVNLFLLFLVTLAWWSLRTRRAWLAAVAVAAPPLIKIQYVFLLPFLWWTGQRRVATRGLLLWVMGVGGGLVFLGPAHYLAYVRYLLSPPEYLHAWTANLSLRATLYRLVAGWAHGAAIANGLTLILALALVVGLVRATSPPVPPDSPSTDWTWGLGLVALLLLSPFTAEHHLVILLLPLTLLLLTEPDPPFGRWDYALLLGGALLLASRYSLDQFPAFHQGMLSLVAAGKTLGVAALGWLLARRLRGSGAAGS